MAAYWISDDMWSMRVSRVRSTHGGCDGCSVPCFRIRDDSIFGRVKQRMRDWFYQFE